MKKGWQLHLAQPIGEPECPLMVRWIVNTPIGSIRLHHFLQSDSDRMLHDHPWSFVTIPLSRGGYDDETYCSCHRSEESFGCLSCDMTGRVLTRVPAFRVTRRPAHHTHAVKLSRGPCWTLVITGPPIRDWGFWGAITGGFHRFYESRRYFGLFGHPACEDFASTAAATWPETKSWTVTHLLGPDGLVKLHSGDPGDEHVPRCMSCRHELHGYESALHGFGADLCRYCTGQAE